MTLNKKVFETEEEIREDEEPTVMALGAEVKQFQDKNARLPSPEELERLLETESFKKYRIAYAKKGREIPALEPIDVTRLPLYAKRIFPPINQEYKDLVEKVEARYENELNR